MATNTESGGTAEPVGIRTSVVEVVVAFIIMALGIVVVYNSIELGAGWSTDGPGPGYFPFYIGLILTISGGAIIFQTLGAKEKDRSIFVQGDELKRVLSVLIPAAVYVLAILVVGIYVASAIYIALFMVVLGKFSVFKSVLIGLAVNTVFFLMFEVWFKVPLYKGMLEPLAFLGY
jgi:hypothetical protein